MYKNFSKLHIVSKVLSLFSLSLSLPHRWQSWFCAVILVHKELICTLSKWWWPAFHTVLGYKCIAWKLLAARRLFLTLFHVRFLVWAIRHQCHVWEESHFSRVDAQPAPSCGIDSNSFWLFRDFYRKWYERPVRAGLHHSTSSFP